MSLDSESRHLVNFVPFLVAFAAKAVDTHGPSARTLGIFAVLSILSSRVWLVIGNDGLLFLSNIGPWMSHERYAFDSAVLLGLAFWCARSGIVPRIPPIASPAQAQRSIERST
jgi:thiol:disulfide interchange protein